MFVGQRLMSLLEKDEVLCAFHVSLLMCMTQEWVLWVFKPRNLAELTLFSTCTCMVYLDCSWALVVIHRTLHLSGRNCISHWSSHFCNVSRSICRVHRSSSGLILRYRMIIYCFTSHSRFFHLYGDVTIHGGGLQNLGLCSALRAFEQGGSLSCHSCCDTGPRFFRFHPKDHPIHSLITTHLRIWSIYYF
jgi:hypothetical protein